jgi:hypothetical protein
MDAPSDRHEDQACPVERRLDLDAAALRAPARFVRLRLRPYHLTVAAWLAGFAVFALGASFANCEHLGLIRPLELLVAVPATLQLLAVVLAARRCARSILRSSNELAAALGMSLLAVPALWVIYVLIDFQWCGGALF